jgi:predicted dehydrogenase
MQDVLKIGIIGCGHWGPNHVRVFSALPDCTVVAIADQSRARLEAARKMFPQVPGYADYRAMLRKVEVDAVVVSTPTRTHFAIASYALNAGKHVLCEKPLCTELSEGEELIEIAKRRGLVLMVGHVFLFNPGVLKIKELVDTGKIGELRSLNSIRTNLGPVRGDVNAAWDLASHDIAIFNWILGTLPITVQAMGAAFLQPGIEDVVNIAMRYPGNVLASIQCSWLDPKKVRQMTLVGSTHMITWDDLLLSNPVAIYEKSAETQREVNDYGEFLRVAMLEGEVRLPKVQVSEPLKVQNVEFVRAICEGRAPLSDGEFGLGVVRVLQQISESIKSVDTIRTPHEEN